MTINPMLIWFLVGLALILVEFALPSIILVFFGLGAWTVVLTTLVGITGSLWSQLLVFAAASVLLLFGLRRWVRSRFLGHKSGEQDPDIDLDDFTGQRVPVVRRIEPGSVEGRVEFKGAEWKAIANTAIAEGQLAKIVAVEGITLRVVALPEEDRS